MAATAFIPLPQLLLTVTAAVVATALTATPALRRGEHRKALLTASRTLLAGTVLAVLVLTLRGEHRSAGLNLVPGTGIRDDLTNVNHTLGLLNLVGNVLMFTPIGFLLPLATGWRGRTSTATCAALSVLIEVAQLTQGRSGDVDDVILNTIGAAWAQPPVHPSRYDCTGAPALAPSTTTPPPEHRSPAGPTIPKTSVFGT